MANLHKPWILSAVERGLARIGAAKVTVKNVPNQGDVTEVPFESVEFIVSDAAGASALYALAETSRTKDDEGNLRENPLNTLLAYAYGLNCRTKVRAQFEGKFEDPDKAIKKIAEMLVKAGRFKSLEKALAAARLMQETEDDS